MCHGISLVYSMTELDILHSRKPCWDWTLKDYKNNFRPHLFHLENFMPGYQDFSQKLCLSNCSFILLNSIAFFESSSYERAYKIAMPERQKFKRHSLKIHRSNIDRAGLKRRSPAFH